MNDVVFAEPSISYPLFYRSPTLLRFSDHAGFGLRHGDDYRFASAAPAIPIVTGEFSIAGRHYPIVFASDDSAMPLAVTGVAPHRNLFVNEDGRWTPGRYVPSYVRRYPFIAITVDGKDGSMLGIDASSGRISTDATQDDALPLFDAAGEATEHSLAAMNLCAAYASEHVFTQAFVEALKANRLLVERKAQMDYAGLGQSVIQGFKIVDERAYRALPEPVVLEFHRKGWLDLIILHLASQASWQTLLEVSAPASQ